MQRSLNPQGWKHSNTIAVALTLLSSKGVYAAAVWCAQRRMSLEAALWLLLRSTARDQPNPLDSDNASA